MKEKSIKKNAVVHAIRTVVNMVFPLISFPYASRVFLVEGMGKYNFASSVVSYFGLIAALGIYQYGVREGAKRRDKSEKINRFCNELFSINIYATILAYVLMILAIVLIPKLHGYAGLILVISLQLILTTIRCQWIYSVFEDYSFFASVTIVMQILAIVLMLVFVHDQGDLYKYALFSVIAYCGPGLPMYIYLRKYVRLKFVLKPSLEHLKPIFLIFSSTIATVIYVSSDVTILGWLKGDYYTGLYSTSANVYKIVKEVLLAVVSVTVPRIAYYIGINERKRLGELVKTLLDYMVLLVVPAMIGLFFMSRQIVELFAGPAYSEAAASLRILSIALLFSIFTYIFMSAILIPFGREREVMIMTWASALINIGLNFILVPYFADRAAAFTTIVAEAFMCVMTYLFAKKKVKLQISGKVVLSTVLGCIIIAILCRLVEHFVAGLLKQLVLGVGGSVIAYAALQVLFKNPIFPGKELKKCKL